MHNFKLTLFIYLISVLSVPHSVLGFPQSSHFLESRIIDGTPASIGQFPYQAGLKLKYEGLSILGTCGGALISEDYVLTAAHCVLDMEYIEVHLGTVNFNDEDNHVVTRVPKENFIVHGWFDEETLTNDIALLKLPQKAPVTDTIKPIDLPTYHDAYRLDLSAHNATASGWGRYLDESWAEAPSLQYAQVRVVDQTVCKHFYRDLRSSMICTSTGRGQGTCHGDSGGPLMYRDDVTKRTVLVGLTSYGHPITCVGAGWPSVFTRVSSFLDWINYSTDIPIKDN